MISILANPSPTKDRLQVNVPKHKSHKVSGGAFKRSLIETPLTKLSSIFQNSALGHSENNFTAESRKHAFSKKRTTTLEISMKNTSLSDFEAPIKQNCFGKIAQLWSKFILRPRSRFKFVWDILIIVLSIWNSIAIPIDFSFPDSLP